MVFLVSCGTYTSLAIVAMAIIFAVQVAQGRDNFDRRSCILPSGSTGICKLITECPVVLANWFHQRPKICGRQGRIPIVCCPGGPSPITDISPPTTNFDCGKTIQFREPIGFFRRKRARPEVEVNTPPKVPTIVRPIESERNAWPWMVLLGQGNGDSRIWFCSGVLINSQWVLSAAHCTNRFNATVVRLGEHDLNSGVEEVDDVGVADIIYHPSYQPPEAYHDIVLIKLATPIKLRSGVGPVCLPWGSEANRPLEGSIVTITGWGATYFNGEGSPVLNEASVTVFSTEVCAKSYATLIDTSDYPQSLGEESLCIGDNSDEPSDSCQGDSGGPAVLLHDGRYTLVGIISNGVGCGKKFFPGIYVRVQYPEHLAWIKKVAFSNT